MGTRQTRRQLLRASGFAVAAGLAGCSGSPTGSETSGSTEETTDEQPSEQSTEAQPVGVWGFDDQAANEGLPEGFEDPLTDPDRIEWRGDRGRVGTEEVTASRSYEGSNSYHASDSATANEFQIRPVEQPYDTPMTNPVSVALRRPDINNEPADSLGGGRAALRLHEGPTEPCLGIAKRHDRLTVERYGTRDITVAEIGPDAWVYVTVHSFDLEEGTFSLSWESPDDSGTETYLRMSNDMDAGYDQTVIMVDNEGYADVLSIDG